jgi:NCS1 family nucleobase:cation symporter-1
MNYIYGFVSASFAYWALSYLFPARDSLLDACIYDDPDIVDSSDSVGHDEHDVENPVIQEKMSTFVALDG